MRPHWVPEDHRRARGNTTVVDEAVHDRRAPLRDRWARLSQVPAGRDAFLTLPVLDSDKPWEISADGACLIRSGEDVDRSTVPRGHAQRARPRSLPRPSDFVDVSTVEFHLTGGDFSDTLIGVAVRRYFGWAYAWDTTSVPNGSYTLTSVASNPLGLTATSAGVDISVKN